MAEFESVSQESAADLLADVPLMELGLRKMFLLCLDATMQEPGKFATAVNAFEALLGEKVATWRVQFKDKQGKPQELPYLDYFREYEQYLAHQYPAKDDAPLRAGKLAADRFRELTKMIDVAPTKIMYEVRPGRADLYAVKKLREYADKVFKEPGFGPAASEYLMELAKDLERELKAEYSKEFEEVKNG